MLEEKRVRGALEKLSEIGVEQMLICEPYAIYYFLGKMFYGGERFTALLIKKDGSHKMFLNKLFPKPENLGIDIVWLEDTDNALEIVAAYMDKGKTIGVDKELPAKFLLPIMEKMPESKCINASLAIDKQRQVKDSREQELMFLNSRINDEAMTEFKKLIVPGVTEKQIQEKMPDIYKSLGCEKFGFGIVAFGKNAADPHHMSDDTVLQEGDAVLFDVGAIKGMYNSDMTRTFFYKSYTEKNKEIYEIVKKANEEAEKAIKPGLRYCDIDKVARDIITEAGYGAYFTHRLGHNIGLTCHEYGDVSSTNTDVLEPGMFFSIEPGIYLTGEFGVRIEDLVMVTEDGCKVINSYSKELEIVN